MTYGIVYVATSRTSGKSYVGQTTQPLLLRWRQHRFGGCRVLAAAVRKYGASDFDVREIDSAESATELDDKEKFWIAKLNTPVPNGYNLKEGGANGKPSAETRQRLSESHTGLVMSAPTRERMRVAQAKRRETESRDGSGPVFTAVSRDAMRRAKTGTRHSAETKAKMSDARRGRTPSEETKDKLRKRSTGRRHSADALQKMSDAQKGRRHSDETKKKMSEARRGVSRPASVVEKIAAANQGQRRSPEARARMSAAKKEFWERKRALGGITDGS